ncbi:hypothetical protein BH23ACT10_BH23ACT10_24990 [soil metagenome]
MPTIADYIVIRDGPFELTGSNPWSSGNISIPNDLVPGTITAKAVLQYKVRPTASPPFAPSAEIEVRVNGRSVETIRLSTDTVHGLWEVFPATILNADSAANFVEFRAESGFARISDVILWFQRDI